MLVSYLAALLILIIIGYLVVVLCFGKSLELSETIFGIIFWPLYAFVFMVVGIYKLFFRGN